MSIVQNNTTLQGIRFLIGGITNTLLTYVIYLLLLYMIPYTTAYTLSYAMGIISGFTINTYFVFRSKWNWMKFFSFPLIHIFNYIASMGLLVTSTEILGAPKEISPIIAIIIMLPINFILTRALIAEKTKELQKSRPPAHSP